jgi:hypothetical protein
MKNKIKTFLALMGCWFLLLSTHTLWAQQILIDEPTQAGELILFPDIKDGNRYYFVSDKPRIALQESGTPQFSFLNYVKNAEEGAQGGGIVHAVIELSVTENQLQEARQELRRINPEGEIAGPVMWKGGTIALVSSFATAGGELTEQVIGLGKAPVLDGEKAAISVQLTQKGAEILWQSFQTTTPDMSVSFEMELQGFRAPKNAVIEANFDQIYEHKSFNSAVATPFLAAEINTAYDDLRRSGAIKVTNLGADEQMEALITTAYNKLTEIMFEPLGGTGTPNLQQLTGTGGQGGSMLDRATKMLADVRNEARQENARIRQENRNEVERVRVGNERIAQQNQQAQANASNAESGSDNGVTASADTTINGGRPLPRSQQPPIRPGKAQMQVKPTDQPGEVVLENLEPNLQEEVETPKLAIMASFQIKKVRNQGNFRIDLNKSTVDVITLRFDENFGEFTAKCSSCFHQVNLDDPLYKQREITAFVDGMNAEDFGEYINYVAVTMTKNHEGGDITHDELNINRNNFNQEGNNFKLLYGWKNDQNRNDWMNYQYKTVWSFFGGHTIETEPQVSNTGALNLAPPFQRKSVKLEADPELLASSGVRLVNVKIHYQLAGKEFSKQLTLNTKQEPVAGAIEFMLPKGETDYDYEIEWRLAGNQVITSGRQHTSLDYLLVDELPVH